MNLDKLREDYWNRAFPDPQDKKVWVICSITGCEIYEGETCIALPNGKYIVDDKDILIEYIDGHLIVAGEEDL